MQITGSAISGALVTEHSWVFPENPVYHQEKPSSGPRNRHLTAPHLVRGLLDVPHSAISRAPGIVAATSQAAARNLGSIADANSRKSIRRRSAVSLQRSSNWVRGHFMARRSLIALSCHASHSSSASEM
jgi:hypothetical protein